MTIKKYEQNGTRLVLSIKSRCIDSDSTRCLMSGDKI